MLCAAAEWSLISSAQALGVVMEGYCHRLFGALSRGSYSGGLAFLPWTLAGHGAKALGGFLGQKILTYTQLAHPIIMQPLLHHGKPFAGGVPIKKLPLSIWQTVMGHWDPTNDAGVYKWLEDKKDEMGGWFDSTLSAVGNLSNFAKNE